MTLNIRRLVGKMKKKTTIAVLLVLLALGATAQAQENSKFWIMPTVGYRTTGSFAISSEDVAYTNLKVEDALAYGLTLGYRFHEAVAVEFSWSRSHSAMMGIYPPVADQANDNLFEVNEDQFQANLLLSAGYLIGKIRPYFLIGMGLTSVNPSGDVSGITRLAWDVGMGLEGMISKKIGLKGQVKLVPTHVSNMETILMEWDGGYQAATTRNMITQWEFTPGLVFHL